MRNRYDWPMPAHRLPQETRDAAAAALEVGEGSCEIMARLGIKSRQTLARIAREYGVPPECRPSGARPRTLEVDAQYGRLRVIEEVSGSTPRMVRCLCECGTGVVVRLNSLARGRSRSCGCLHSEIATNVIVARNRTPRQREASRNNVRAVLFDPEVRARTIAAAVAANRTHGLGRHPFYNTWHDMMRRCYNPATKHYRNYGGRGIAVSLKWHDVAAFVSWMEDNLGPRPKGMSLDRIDNDGNYEPGNLRWATKAQQCANRRTVASLTAERDALLLLVASLQSEKGRLF